MTPAPLQRARILTTTKDTQHNTKNIHLLQITRGTLLNLPPRPIAITMVSTTITIWNKTETVTKTTNTTMMRRPTKVHHRLAGVVQILLSSPQKPKMTEKIYMIQQLVVMKLTREMMLTLIAHSLILEMQANSACTAMPALYPLIRLVLKKITAATVLTRETSILASMKNLEKAAAAPIQVTTILELIMKSLQTTTMPTMNKAIAMTIVIESIMSNIVLCIRQQ